MKKNVLVTGSEGYIGSNFIHLLKWKNIDYVGVDRITNRTVENIGNLYGITHVVHLAALSSIKNCRENYNQAVIDNISATFHIFHKSYRRRLPLVFASSGSAQSPEDNFYATTKRIGELEAIRLNKKGANIKILRFANVYGGINYLDKKKSVVAKFYKDDPLVVNGNGSQTRDMIHVSDICESIWLALNEPTIINEPMGVGTGINTSILDLAKMFNKKITFNPDSDLVGPDESPSDISLSFKYLGFKSSIDLDIYVSKILTTLLS